MPRIPVEFALETALGLIRRSVTQKTWEAYSKVWREWELLLAELGADSQDRETVLMYFIGRGFSLGVSPSGLGRSLSALAFWFKIRGERDWTKSFLVRQAVRGFRRGSSFRDTRRPVSFDILLRLGAALEGLCFSVFEVLVFRLAFSFAFFGAFRISELVAPSRIREGGLRAEDVQLKEASVECFLRRSKTDQRGRGSMVVFQALVVSPMCPVRCYGEYVQRRPAGPGPLLRHEDGSWLSQFQFTQVFRKGLIRIGVDPLNFSSHSFRIGAATEASRWGLGPETVRKIGRWESNRYRLYVRPHLITC